MTEDQRNQYEEAAKEYAENNYFYGDMQSGAKRGFRAGCEYAHSKIKEAEREAHNRAIDEAEHKIRACFAVSETPFQDVIEQLKKLRK